MGSDFSVSGFVAAGGGVAYVLVAVLWAASRGRPLERLLVAGLLGVQGLFVVLQSLTTPEATSTSSLTSAERFGLLLIGWTALGTAILGGAVALVVARRTSRRALVTVGLALALTLLLGLLSMANGGITPGKGDPAQIPAGVGLVYVVFLVAYAATAVASLAFALDWKSDPKPATALLGAGLAVLPVATLLWGATRTTPETLFAVIGLACILAWLPPWPGDARLPRAVLWGLLAWGLFYEVYPILRLPSGSGQATLAPFEVAAALAIAVALLRYQAWGIQPPRVAARRGALTAAALATLFIVAQVVQNFFSAEYGLLTGGIIAGAFLFASQPIQRALERRGESRPTSRATKPDQGQDDRYRSALRLVLRDRIVTREEEIELHRLAEGLGIPTGRAHELLVEVERESSAKRNALRRSL